MFLRREEKQGYNYTRFPAMSRITARSILIYIAYAATAVVLIVLPIILRELPISIIRNTKGHSSERFELFGFLAFVAIVIVAGNEIRKRWSNSRDQLLPIIIGVLVSLNFLTLITGYPVKSRDYLHYEQAGAAFIKGKNPYQSRTYLYPPLFAQGMVAAHHAVDQLYVKLLNKKLPAQRSWDLVFYLYQCNQFFLVVIGYLLCYRFARANKIPPLTASFLVASLFLFNTPLFRTLRHNQVNLWVLDLTLAGILALPRWPLLSGAAVVFAAHIKVYPYILGLPWLVARQWRAVAAMIIVSAGIVMFQTDFFRDWTIWLQASELFQTFPGKVHFRDNSLHSVTFNLIHMPALLFENPQWESLRVVSEWLFRIVDAVVILLFVRRFLQREKIYGRLSEEDRLETNSQRLYGHSVDGLALALLIAPSVWEHVYILAMPVFLYAAALSNKGDFVKVCLAGFFIFAVPIFDVFPLSYHRLAGLLFLLYFYSPKRLGHRHAVLEQQPATVP